MKPFICSISYKHRLAKSSSDSEETWFAKAASFVGQCRAVRALPLGGKCLFLSLRVLLALQVLICTRAALLSLKELETLQMYLQHHTAATHHAQIGPILQRTPPSRAHSKAHTIRGLTRPLLLGADLVPAPRPVLTMTNTSPSASALALLLH